MRAVTIGASFVVLALALTGCGASIAETTVSSTDETESAANDTGAEMPDPCLLLDPATIEQHVGFSVDAGLAEADRQTSHSALCEWSQSDGRGFVAVAIAPNYRIPYGEGESAVGTAVAIDIPGATEAHSVNGGVSVGMSVDGDYVVVSGSGAFSGERVDTTIALATEIVSRLG